MRKICVCAWAIVCLLSASIALAQSFQGGLRGSVMDGDGVIPGVTVTLVNQATSLVRDTVTNDLGEYAFAAVTPGVYTVRASLQGFKTFERSGLTIGTQQFITLDLPMVIGTIEEQITVKGEAPVIETSNASIGHVLDNKTLESLPALNRNAYMSAVTTVPTVQAQGNPYFSRMEDQTNGSLVSLGGGPLRANNYLLDGVSVTDLQNRTSVFVTPEAIEELKVQVHTYDAEMGRSGGGVFNTTGRSGTNTFKGSAFAQVRPNWALSVPYFDAAAGKPKLTTPYYRYWGGSVGGPIKENKTFFWFAHEGYLTNSALSSQLLLPTSRELAGDFSQSFDRQGRLIVIYDPLTTRLLPNGSYTRDPFPGNVIPSGRVNPVAANIARFLPTPDSEVSAASGLANKQVTVPVATWADQVLLQDRAQDQRTGHLHRVVPRAAGQRRQRALLAGAQPVRGSEPGHRNPPRLHRRAEQHVHPEQHDGREPALRLDVLLRSRGALQRIRPDEPRLPGLVRRRGHAAEVSQREHRGLHDVRQPRRLGQPVQVVGGQRQRVEADGPSDDQVRRRLPPDRRRCHRAGQFERQLRVQQGVDPAGPQSHQRPSGERLRDVSAGDPERHDAGGHAAPVLRPLLRRLRPGRSAGVRQAHRQLRRALRVRVGHAGGAEP